MPFVPSADDLLVRLRATEAAFARDARRQRIRWRYRLDRRRILFDREARAAYRRFRQSIAAFLRESSLTKHGGRGRAPHAHYPLFPEYGDAAGYRAEAPALRAALGRPRALGRIHGRRRRSSKRRAS